MGENTKVPWADDSFSLWWGCAPCSEGCANCYARRQGKRRHVEWGEHTPRLFASEAGWQNVLRWNRRAARLGQRRLVFCMSMGDLFEDIQHEESRAKADAARGRLWEVIEQTTRLDWLLLTKRVQNVLRLTPERWREGWPRNAWLGFTAETHRNMILRLPYALAVPAKRFVSIEPMLGAIHLDGLRTDGIDWVIVGGERGPRPMHPSWVRIVRDWCSDHGVPFYFKQWGAWAPARDKRFVSNGQRPSHPRFRPDLFHEWGDGYVAHRVGHRRAGNMIDGQTWEQFPPEFQRT